MTTRQISDIVEDIYGFEVSESMVTAVTNKNITSNRGMATTPFISCVSDSFH